MNIRMYFICVCILSCINCGSGSEQPYVCVPSRMRKTPSFCSLFVLPASSHCPGTCAALLDAFRVCEYPGPWAVKSTSCWLSARHLTVPVLQLSPGIFASAALADWKSPFIPSVLGIWIFPAWWLLAGDGLASSQVQPHSEFLGLSILLLHHLTLKQHDLKPLHQMQLASWHETLFWNYRSA